MKPELNDSVRALHKRVPIEGVVGLVSGVVPFIDD